MFSILLSRKSSATLIVCSCALGTMVPGAVMAGKVGGTVDVTMKLVASCSINGSSEEGGTFGTLDFSQRAASFKSARGAILHQGHPIQVLCSTGFTPKFIVMGGTHDEYSGASANHAMHYNDAYIPYNLFADRSYAEVLEPKHEYLIPGKADGSTPQEVLIYARAYAAPNLVPGTYTDRLMVSFNF